MTVATVLVGKDCKVTLGTNKVLGMGTWTMGGVSTDLLESTEFGDNWKRYKLGLKDGGEISCSGFYDKTDTTGQDALRTANELGTSITDIRFYVDSTSYFCPCTTNPVSSGLCTGWSIGAEKSGLISAEFTIKLDGKMQLI
jgi:hypothetical protein